MQIGLIDRFILHSIFITVLIILNLLTEIRFLIFEKIRGWNIYGNKNGHTWAPKLNRLRTWSRNNQTQNTLVLRSVVSASCSPTRTKDARSKCPQNKKKYKKIRRGGVVLHFCFTPVYGKNVSFFLQTGTPGSAVCVTDIWGGTVIAWPNPTLSWGQIHSYK